VARRRRRGGGGAAAFALSVSTPGSANAGQFLSPTQFRDQFSPTSQDLSAVTAWLKDQGFSIGYTASTRRMATAVARRWFADGNLTIHVGPGYDDVTGLGCPNGEAWLSGLSH